MILMNKHNTEENPHRIRAEDLTQAICRQDSTVVSAPSVIETVVFTIKGKQNDLDDNDYPILWDVQYEDSGKLVQAETREEAYAMKRSNCGVVNYYVKMASGTILNPNSMYAEFKHQKRSKIGEKIYQFQRVGKKVFEYYLQFLKTKNATWLANAQREYL